MSIWTEYRSRKTKPRTSPSNGYLRPLGPSRFSSPKDTRLLLTSMGFRTQSPLTESPWPHAHIRMPHGTRTLAVDPKPSLPPPRNPWLLTLRSVTNCTSRQIQKAFPQFSTALYLTCYIPRKYLTPYTALCKPPTLFPRTPTDTVLWAKCIYQRTPD